LKNQLNKYNKFKEEISGLAKQNDKKIENLITETQTVLLLFNLNKEK